MPRLQETAHLTSTVCYHSFSPLWKYGSRLVCGKGNRSSADRTSVAVKTGIFTVLAKAVAHPGSEIYIVRLCQAKQNPLGEGLHHTISELGVNNKEMYVSMNMCGVVCVAHISRWACERVSREWG